MTFRQYALVMSLISLLAWGGWFLILFFVDPTNSGIVGPILFYMSLGAALLGSLSLIGLFVRVVIIRKAAILSKEVGNAFRQALLLSALCISLLVLMRYSLLSWWNSPLLILAAVCLELFLFAARPDRASLPENTDA